MAGSDPIDTVLFDLHSTLVDQGDAQEWLDRGWRAAGLPGGRGSLGPARHARLLNLLDRIWSFAQEVDPAARRDLDPVTHRTVFHAVLTGEGFEERLAGGLYETLLDPWRAYDDAAPTMRALRDAGIRVVVLSNIGIDARPMLARTGLLPLADAVLLSCEVGVVKPDPAIFRIAVLRVGSVPQRALMVGDSPADAGALTAGIRTLLLPRTRLPVHGLDAVLRLARA